MGYNLHSAISALLHLKRKCPTCGREQIVPAKDRDKTVPCKFCHEPVPAPAHKEANNEESDRGHEEDEGS